MLTFVDGGKVFVEQPIQNGLQILLLRKATTLVDILFVDNLEGVGSALEDVEHLAHITAGQIDQSLLAILGDVNLFVLNYKVETIFDLSRLERGETKLGATRLNGRDDLVEVVANETKANIQRILFDNCNLVN